MAVRDDGVVEHGLARVPACEAAAKVAANDRRIIFQLGRAYFATKDYENARAQYRRADELGSLMATNNLGHLLTAGGGGPPGLVEGRQLLEKATAGGVAFAMWNLGYLHATGNVAIEYRFADGQTDRLQALAADLVRRQVNSRENRRAQGWFR